MTRKSDSSFFYVTECQSHDMQILGRIVGVCSTDVPKMHTRAKMKNGYYIWDLKSKTDYMWYDNGWNLTIMPIFPIISIYDSVKIMYKISNRHIVAA